MNPCEKDVMLITEDAVLNVLENIAQLKIDEVRLDVKYYQEVNDYYVSINIIFKRTDRHYDHLRNKFLYYKSVTPYVAHSFEEMKALIQADLEPLSTGYYFHNKYSQQLEKLRKSGEDKYLEKFYLESKLKDVESILESLE